MKRLADGVWQLSGFPPNAINVFVIEDVLIDASTRYATRRILRNVEGHRIVAHALTHAHPDHQGASHQVCERLGIPFWVGEPDADAAERPELIGQRQPDHFMAQFFFQDLHRPRAIRWTASWSRATRSAASRSSHVPGHSAGHVAFWRESDRVLIAGDVFNTADPLLAIPGLREPKPYFTPDPAHNRRSAKRLGELEPRLLLVGHGPPYRDTRKFVDFCANLPASRARRPRPSASASASRTASHWRPIDSSVCRISYGFEPRAGRKSSAIPRAYTGHISSSIAAPSSVSWM